MIVHVYLHGFLYSISQPGSQLMRCSRQGRVSQPHLLPRNSCAFLTKASKESQGKGLPPGEDKHTLSFTNQNVTGKAKQLLWHLFSTPSWSPPASSSPLSEAGRKSFQMFVILTRWFLCTQKRRQNLSVYVDVFNKNDLTSIFCTSPFHSVTFLECIPTDSSCSPVFLLNLPRTTHCIYSSISLCMDSKSLCLWLLWARIIFSPNDC